MNSMFRFALIVISISFWTSYSNAVYGNPVCSAFYGQPNDLECYNLLWGIRSARQGRLVGLAFIDTDAHVFAQPGVPDTGDS